jgi:ribosome-associated toxin RatA of RatAB toxin-antitoxin module
MRQSVRLRRSRAAAWLIAASVIAAAGLAAAAAEPSPLVTVQPDPQGASGLVHAQVDIAATPETVWKIIVDCDQMPKLMVNVKTCRVLQREPAGRWDQREVLTRASLLPGIRTVMRSDYDEPRSVHFHRTDGDFKILEGQWLLQPLDGGTRTRVIYDSRISPPVAAPAGFIRAALRGDMVRTLNNLRGASEARAVVASERP